MSGSTATKQENTSSLSHEDQADWIGSNQNKILKPNDWRCGWQDLALPTAANIGSTLLLLIQPLQEDDVNRLYPPEQEDRPKSLH